MTGWVAWLLPCRYSLAEYGAFSPRFAIAFPVSIIRTNPSGLTLGLVALQYGS